MCIMLLFQNNFILIQLKNELQLMLAYQFNINNKKNQFINI